MGRKKEETERVVAKTEELRQLLLPDELESVLASLQFKKVISRYRVGPEITTVEMPKGRSLVLLDLLEES